MGEIQGTVRNFQWGSGIMNFDVEWKAGNGSYGRRNVQMRSGRFLGALWNGIDVKLFDDGKDPITVNEVVILGKVNAAVSTHLEKWQRKPQESLEGEVLRFTGRLECIRNLGATQGIGWLPVWDLELGDGEPEALVEFRSEKPWNGSISEGDRIKVYGTRSSRNVLLATRLEDETNGVKVEYQRAWYKWWLRRC